MDDSDHDEVLEQLRAEIRNSHTALDHAGIPVLPLTARVRALIQSREGLVEDLDAVQGSLATANVSLRQLALKVDDLTAQVEREVASHIADSDARRELANKTAKTYKRYERLIAYIWIAAHEAADREGALIPERVLAVLDEAFHINVSVTLHKPYQQ